jgi:hypothetical protein
MPAAARLNRARTMRANRASPSMLASFPANMVNHDSPPLENPPNRFCLFGPALMAAPALLQLSAES